VESLVILLKIVRSERIRKRKRKSTSWLLAVLMTGIVIFLLYFQCFNLQVGRLIQVLIFTCVLTSFCFLLTRGSKVLPSWWKMDHMLLFVVLAQ
jgi:predicted anti-sigma-YlaC factor YlaD